MPVLAPRAAARATLAALALATAIASAAAAQDWRRIRYPDAGFAVAFPSQPTVVRGKTKDGRPKVTYKAGDPKLQYRVSYRQLGDVWKSKGYADRAFGAVRRSLKAPKRNRVLGERKVALDGIPGREFRLRVRTKIDVMLTVRLYIHRDRLYQVLVAAEKGLERKTETKRFFDSFRIIRK